MVFTLNQRFGLITWICIVHLDRFCFSTQYGEVFELCKHVTAYNITQPLLVVNKGFPGYSTLDTNCTCSVDNNRTGFTITPIFLSLNGSDQNPTPLILTIDDQSFQLVVEEMERVYRYMYTKRNYVRNVKISVTHFHNNPNVNYSFALSVRPLASRPINVTCMTSSSDKETEQKEKETKTDRKVNEENNNKSTSRSADKLASPTLVIVLASVCLALLLIIAFVSIMLCCVMPRKQRRQIKQIRNSMTLLDNDVRYIRPTSHIYDNTNTGNTGGTSQHSLSVPHHYDNFENKQRESGFYQNIQQ